MVTAALVTGNAVVFKPAEQTPGHRRCGWSRSCIDAGRAAGRARVPARASARRSARRWSSIRRSRSSPSPARRPSGSRSIEARGRAPAGQRHVKRVVAEMGGKNAIVVDADADLDQAVPAIVPSAFGYAGQKCSAAARLIAVGPRLRRAARAARRRRPRSCRSATPRELAHRRRPADRRATRSERVRALPGAGAPGGRGATRRDDVPAGGWYVGPTVIVDQSTRRPASSPRRSSGRSWSCSAPTTSSTRSRSPTTTDYALTGGLFSRCPSHIARAPPRTPRRQPVRQPRASPARASAGSRSAATASPASARRPAAPTISCSSSSRGRDREHPPPGICRRCRRAHRVGMPRRLPRCPIRLDLDPRRPLPDRLGRLDSVLAGGAGPCAGRRPD